MTAVRGVPAPKHLIPTAPVLSTAPAAGPLDQVTRARVRRLLIGFFGEFDTLDLHLDLLDARGAWYAEAALGAWSPGQPDAFFGLVRHVVRTQLGGPTPAPDIEDWLRAGVPAQDPVLAERWREIWRLRPNDDEEPAPRCGQRSDAIALIDAIVEGWPAEHWDRFLLTYVKLELVLARRAITLPPIGS